MIKLSSSEREDQRRYSQSVIELRLASYVDGTGQPSNPLQKETIAQRLRKFRLTPWPDRSQGKMTDTDKVNS